MLRCFILLASLGSVAYGADYETFKNCSRIPFCTALRYNTVEPSKQFTANISEIKQDEDATIVVPLHNEEGEHLFLNIYFLVGGKIRIKVLEENHNRYEIVDVLDGEPEKTNLHILDVKERSLTLSQLGNEQYKVAVIEGPPFKVEFYYRERLQVIFNSERLLIENTDESKVFAFTVEFPGSSNLYGLFNHAYNLTLGETADGSSDPFRFRNSDNYAYDSDSTMALYGSIPVIYGHSFNYTSGIFFHNAAEQWIDISYKTDNPSAYFMVEGGTLDLFVLTGPTPKQVVRQYTQLTGVAHMPQLWTLGYHQCRYTYYTQEEIKEVVALMDVYDFPLDGIWLDDGHSFANRYFLWNPVNFSDPLEMQRNISYTLRKAVTILDPHIKVESNYSVYAGAEGKYFVKWINGSDFQGDCWPGLSSYIDYLNPEARDYYASWYHYDKFNLSTSVIAGVWNDMNEPSVFDESIEKTLPFTETVHYGGVLHRDIHNLYGFLQTMSTHQGLMERDNGTRRPFILTRSHFAGSQRYTAMWTGDNRAEWGHLRNSYAECMTANILGMVFCGADVGGFTSEPTTELFQRWFQAGAWYPFFRGHSSHDTPRREPYRFDEDVQSVIRQAIKMRYKHIPVFYTLFYEHTRNGDPILAPLFYYYPDYFDFDGQMLVGPNIMVTPVMEENATSLKVSFPGTKDTYWYRADENLWNIYTGGTDTELDVDITTAPLFYRSGSIITRKDIERPTTTNMIDDPYTLYVNLDVNNTAIGRLYIDDYFTFEYKNSQSYLYLELTYLPTTHGIRIHQVENSNSANFDFTILSIVVHSLAPNNIKQQEKGVGKDAMGIKKTIYTTTSDGTPLENIKINLNKTNDFILHL